VSQKGVCQFCSCTWTNPCYPPCAWANRAETVCSSARCLRDAAKAHIKLLPSVAGIAAELLKLYPGQKEKKVSV
jgi:hypothetical protein